MPRVRDEQSGYTTEQKATGFTERMEDANPDLARELKDASSGRLGLSDASWIRERQEILVYDTEDESQHHIEMDPKSASFAIHDTFLEARDEMGNRETAADDIVQSMHTPIILSFQEAGKDFHDMKERNGDSIKDTWTRLANRTKLGMRQGAEALNGADPDDFLDSILLMQDTARDIPLAMQPDRHMNFEDRATQATGDSDWTEIALPEHREEAWTILQDMRREWSHTFIMETARELAEAVNDPVWETLAEKQAGMSNEAGEYFETRMENAADLTESGYLLNDKTVFDMGMDAAAKVKEELLALTERGIFPEPRDDGSRRNEYALQRLEEARH